MQLEDTEMKKRLFALAFVLAICLSLTGSALAEPESQFVVAPMSAVIFSSGLQKVSGSTYTAWASAGPMLAENVTVGFTLNRVVGSVETYVASASNAGYGYYVVAQQNIILTAGRYVLRAWY